MNKKLDSYKIYVSLIFALISVACLADNFIVAQYEFETDSGKTVGAGQWIKRLDDSIGKNHATPSSTRAQYKDLTYVNSAIQGKYAGHLKGWADYIDLSKVPVEGENGFTVGFFFKPDWNNMPKNQYKVNSFLYLRYGGAAYPAAWEKLSIMDNGDLAISYPCAYKKYKTAIVPAKKINWKSSKWYYIAGVWSYSKDEKKSSATVYIYDIENDNWLTAATDFGKMPYYKWTAGSRYLGGFKNSDTCCDGTFDVVTVNNKPLDQKEICATVQKVLTSRPKNNINLTVRNMKNWSEFDISLKPASSSAVSLEFLLDAPAGKHGFLKIKDGHFIFEDGTPARFWGTNIHAAQGIFPTHKQAKHITATLARYGCNIVRLHLPEMGLIDKTKPDRQTLITGDKLDRFDYFIKCLKDKGIYICMDSILGLSGRKFQPADNVVNGDKYFQHKSWSHYSERLQKIGRDFMKNLLCRKNKYTGIKLVDDPVLAMTLLINEQSIFWNDLSIPAYYKNILKKKFNKWLLQEYGSRKKLAEAWTSQGKTFLGKDEKPAAETVNFPSSWLNTVKKNKDSGSAKKIRAYDAARFMVYEAKRYFTEIKNFAQHIGLKVPVIGTNIHFYIDELRAYHILDGTAQNAYWDHPSYKGAEGNFYKCKNMPQVSYNPLNAGSPLFILPRIAAVKLSDRPVISTENDVMWPNDWRSSHLMMTGALMALQNFDANFQYGFHTGWNKNWDEILESDKVLFPSFEYNDPSIQASFVAGAFLYLRGDVRPSDKLIRIDFSNKNKLTFEGRTWGRSSYPFNYLSFVSGVEIALPECDKQSSKKVAYTIKELGAKTQGEELAKKLDAVLKEKGVISNDCGLQSNKLISQTKEIIRDWGNELFIVNTPKSQGFTGFPTEPIKFKDIIIDCKSPYATIQLSALDGDKLSEAKRIFVVVVARSDNKHTKLKFKSKARIPGGGTRGVDMTILGKKEEQKGPVVIEPVVAYIQFKNNNKGSFKVTPLSPQMIPNRKESKVYTANNGKNKVKIGPTISVWYLIERMN